MNVYIGEPITVTIFDTQWPCPDGFHVPLKKEWLWIYNAWKSIWAWGTWWTNFSTYLKLPMAWYRYNNNSVDMVGWEGDYWTSNASWSNQYMIQFNSSTIYTDYDIVMSSWNYIRWIKNTPTTPDSSWTVLYQWTWTAWIYNNSDLWLISISSDWATWYTIMDKNLWATTVYNYWDTLTDANCGKVFQWGNNYPFPWTKSSQSITASSTKVDASSYWPWNYYNSSVWITAQPWRSSSNNNLRWWVSQWTSTKQIPQEANNIYLWEGKTTVLSDMQWPAPEWFHIPLQNEWSWLYTIMSWLSLTTWDNWKTKLHMPFAGYRSGSNASLYNQGSGGYYWSSYPYGSDYPSNARYLRLSSSNVNANNNSIRADGFSVRCFKDSFEVPTSSWTVIQWTIGSAWIFWNQSDWIISITSDGSTWYTIMDKNLWATSVYNNGDTLSEDNCGKYYQWGNNYWFAWTWSVTTSSTQVNAQNYWPWNYYSSSTFINRNNDWSSVHNDNLRWWTSQWTSTIIKPWIKEVYIWTTKVYPKA